MTASPTGQDETERPRAITPVWPEVAAALTGFALAYALVAVALTHERDHIVTALAGLAASATIGSVAATVAVSVRIRGLAALGVRHTGVRHLLTGAVIGMVAFLLGALAGIGQVTLVDNLDLRAGFGAVATGGWVSLSLTVLTGAILTPLGGEPPLITDDHINSIPLRRPAWILVLLGASSLAVYVRLGTAIPVSFAVGVLTALLVRWCVAIAARGPDIVRISKMAYALTTRTRVD